MLLMMMREIRIWGYEGGKGGGNERWVSIAKDRISVRISIKYIYYNTLDLFIF